ncbi:MAG: hypothetical protein D6800_11555, partial [Candidatus Zixiibacteriota bacterium]
MYWCDPCYVEWAKAHYGTDTSAYYDESLRYYSLDIHFKPDHPIVKRINMTADSVMIFYSPPLRPEAYDGLEPVVTHPCSWVWDITLEPIVIPKSYRRDFWVAFVLTVSHGPEDAFVEQRRISVHCIYTESKWTPL